MKKRRMIDQYGNEVRLLLESKLTEITTKNNHGVHGKSGKLNFGSKTLREFAPKMRGEHV